MSAGKWHIAQLNIARAVAPLDSPALADFVAALDAVNALGEASPGFVWRLQGDVGNATDVKVSDDPNVIVNMTVWESVEALFQFVYRSGHTAFMVRRREWFEKPAEAYQVLWWIQAGTLPTIEDGMERLQHLRDKGSTPHAFTFKNRFPPPDQPGEATDMKPEPYCVGWS